MFDINANILAAQQVFKKWPKVLKNDLQETKKINHFHVLHSQVQFSLFAKVVASPDIFRWPSTAINFDRI